MSSLTPSLTASSSRLPSLPRLHTFAIPASTIASPFIPTTAERAFKKLHYTQTRLRRLTTNNPKHTLISPLAYYKLAHTLPKCQEAIDLIRTPTQRLFDLQTQIQEENDSITAQIFQDQLNYVSRMEIQDLRLYELLLTYGGLLSDVCPKFKAWINGSFFPTKLRSRGDSLCTQLLNRGIGADQLLMYNWEAHGQPRDQEPELRFLPRLGEIAKSLHMSLVKTRNLIRLYIDHAGFGYTEIAAYYVKGRRWRDLAEMLVVDMRCVGEMLATHWFLRECRAVVGEAFAALRDRYFGVLEPVWEEEMGVVRLVDLRWALSREVLEEGELLKKRKAEKISG